MSKNRLIHPLTLLPTTDVDEFEAFIREELPKIVWLDIASCYVLKAIKGDRLPEYLLIIEQEREFYDLPQEEKGKLLREHERKHPNNGKIVEKLFTYVENFFKNGQYTHYELME